MTNKIKISVVGAAGRMGSQVMSQALDSDLFELVGAIEFSGSSHVGNDISSVIGGDKTGIILTDNSIDCILNSDAVIDISSPL